MGKPNVEGDYRELERDLTHLHRPIPLEPSFVAGVEDKILNHAAKLSRQSRFKGAYPRNGWVARIFSTSRALAWAVLAVLLVAGLGWSIRTFLPDQDRAGGSGESDFPTPASPFVERFIWQTDGRSGYRMLRPANWTPVAPGQGQGYAFPELYGTADQLELRALNYQVFQEAQGSSNGAIAQLLLFQENPTLEGWTAGIERMWQQDAIGFTLEGTLPRAKVYWITVPGWDKIQLSAFMVDRDQPLALDLTAPGVYADVDRLRNEGIVDDFMTIVNSLSAIPYDPENVDPPLNDANSIPPDRASSTPTSKENPESLSLTSPHAEIRQRVLNPTWRTIWLQGQATLFWSNTEERSVYVQAWLDREGAGRVLSTDQIAGSLNFNLDMSPRWIWISDGQTLRLFDVQTGQFDPSTADQRWFVHPLESNREVMGMLFPTYLAVRSEDLQVVELSEQAGRPALVVDWAGFRLWVDTQTGVLLRQQIFDENGQVGEDISLSAIAYDLQLPEDVLSNENLDQSRFEPPPDREILPELPVLDPDSRLSSESGEIYFELSGEPPFQWRMAVLPAGCLVSGLACPAPQEIPERPIPQLFLNWSHDGRRAVFADTNFNQLWSFDLDTKRWQVVLESGFQMQLAWSQDDRRLAAVPLESDPNHMNLVWIDSEDWSVHPIPTSLKGNKEIIAWLDEHSLAVTVLPDSFKGGEPEWIAEFQPGLFRVDIETGEFELVRPLNGELGVVPDSLSPDSRYFLVIEEDQGQPSLALAGLDFQEIRPLNVYGDSAQWSPDGQWISFINSGQNLSLVHLDGALVETHLSKVLRVVWSPDSHHLLVQTGEAEANDRLWLVSIEGKVNEVEIPALKES